MKRLFKRITAAALASIMVASFGVTAFAAGHADAPPVDTPYGKLTGWIDSEDNSSSYQKRVFVGSRVGNYSYFKDNTACDGKNMQIRAIASVRSYSNTDSVIDTIDITSKTQCAITKSQTEPYMGFVIYGTHQVCNGITCWAIYSLLRDPL